MQGQNDLAAIIVISIVSLWIFDRLDVSTATQIERQPDSIEQCPSCGPNQPCPLDTAK